MHHTLDVRVVAFRDAGSDTEARLMQVFGIDRATASRVIGAAPIVVKRRVSPPVAERFRRALEDAGARVELVPVGTFSPATREASSLPPPGLAGAPTLVDAAPAFLHAAPATTGDPALGASAASVGSPTSGSSAVDARWAPAPTPAVSGTPPASPAVRPGPLDDPSDAFTWPGPVDAPAAASGLRSTAAPPLMGPMWAGGLDAAPSAAALPLPDLGDFDPGGLAPSPPRPSPAPPRSAPPASQGGFVPPGAGVGPRVGESYGGPFPPGSLQGGASVPSSSPSSVGGWLRSLVQGASRRFVLRLVVGLLLTAVSYVVYEVAAAPDEPLSDSVDDVSDFQLAQPLDHMEGRRWLSRPHRSLVGLPHDSAAVVVEALYRAGAPTVEIADFEHFRYGRAVIVPLPPEGPDRLIAVSEVLLGGVEGQPPVAPDAELDVGERYLRIDL